MTYQHTDEQAMNLWFAADSADDAVPYGTPLELGRWLTESPAFQSIIRAAQAEAWAKAIHHVQPTLGIGVARAAQNDNPHKEHTA